MPQQEQEQEYKQIVHAEGGEADSLLNHPLLKGFFEEEEKKIFEAFKKLPLNCDINDYRTLHCLSEQLTNLKNNLIEKVERAKVLLIREQFDKEQY